MSNQPKRFAAYRIDYSDEPNVKVGTFLVDKRWDLHRTWTTYNRTTGDFTEFGGPRVARLCATCRLKHGRVTPLDHPGDCTPTTPPFLPATEVDR